MTGTAEILNSANPAVIPHGAQDLSIHTAPTTKVRAVIVANGRIVSLVLSLRSA